MLEPIYTAPSTMSFILPEQRKIYNATYRAKNRETLNEKKRINYAANPAVKARALETQRIRRRLRREARQTETILAVESHVVSDSQTALSPGQ